MEAEHGPEPAGRLIGNDGRVQISGRLMDAMGETSIGVKVIFGGLLGDVMEWGRVQQSLRIADPRGGDDDSRFCGSGV